MSYKILTNNSIENTNIDGARAEFFNSGMRDGIVKGALNEGTFNSNASNGVYLDTCELRIAGHRIVIYKAISQTFSTKPSTDKRYSFVAQIKVDDNSNVDFSIIIQDASTKLIKDNLYSNLNGAGTYQVEIGRFTLLTTGTITDVIRTVDIITGNGNIDIDYIRIGEVKTTMLDEGLDAEVDVENVINENTGLKQTNFNFSIPKSAGSIVNIEGQQVASINFNSDPQTQISNNINSINSLQTQVSSNTDNISNLQTQINANTTAISGEITDRTSADEGLQNQINNNTESISNLTAQINNMDNIIDFKTNNPATSYVRFKNGLLIAWGQWGIGKDITNYSHTYQFDGFTFANTNYTLTFQLGVASYNDFMNGVGFNSKSTTGFNYSTRYDQTELNWFAIGKWAEV